MRKLFLLCLLLLTLGSPAFAQNTIFGTKFIFPNGVDILSNDGDPEGVVTAPPSSLYLRHDTGIFYFKLTGTGNTGWVALPASPGTVKSVALTIPSSVFSVSGSPITDTGTLAVSFLNQSGNKGLFSPVDGSSGAPTFRAISNADIAGAGQALTKTDDSNVTLTLGGSPSTALVNAASLTLGWTGQLPYSRGGCGWTSTTTNGVVYGGASNCLTTAAGGANTLLAANSGAPSFTTTPITTTFTTTSDSTVGGTFRVTPDATMVIIDSAMFRQRQYGATDIHTDWYPNGSAGSILNSYTIADGGSYLPLTLVGSRLNIKEPAYVTGNTYISGGLTVGGSDDPGNGNFVLAGNASTAAFNPGVTGWGVSSAGDPNFRNTSIYGTFEITPPASIVTIDSAVLRQRAVGQTDFRSDWYPAGSSGAFINSYSIASSGSYLPITMLASRLNVQSPAHIKGTTFITSGGLDVGASDDPGTGNSQFTGFLTSPSYASETTGWRITEIGEADFRYLFADQMLVKSFIADLEQALAGGQIISKSVTKMALPFTVPDSGDDATMTVADLPSASGAEVFQDSDTIRLRNFSRTAGDLEISDAWGVVSDPVDNGDGTQSWTFTRSTVYPGAMSSGAVVQKDALVLDYGTCGNGYYEVNAIDGLNAVNSPYAQVVTWGCTATGSNPTLTVQARFGNETGITGNSGEYGFLGGNYGAGSDGHYLLLSNLAAEFHGIPIQVFHNSDVVINLSPYDSVGDEGPQFALGDPVPTDYATGDGCWSGFDSGSWKWRCGSPGGAEASWDGSNFRVNGIITVVGSGSNVAKVDFTNVTAHYADSSSTGGNALDTDKVNAVAAATVQGGAAKANLGLDSSGVLITKMVPSTSVGTCTVSGLYAASDVFGFCDGAAFTTYMANNGDFFLGGVSGALTWVASTSTLTISGYATSSSLTSGLAGKIATGGAAADVNANSTVISGGKITVNGSSTFASGYDPTGKIALTEAAADVNANSTTIDGGKITALSITASQIAANTITAAKITAGTITATEIAATTITAGKLNITSLDAITANLGSITAGQIVVGSSNKLWLNDTNDGVLAIGGATKASAPFRVSASGALTATNATISGYATSSDLTSGLGGKVSTGGAAADVNAGSTIITGGKITVNGSSTFGSGYDPTGKIATGGAASDINGNVTTIDGGKITAGSVTATQITAGTITATQIAASTITAAKMNVTSLDAITANMGSLTAGQIVVTTGSDKLWFNDSSDGSIAIGGTTKASAPTIINSHGDITAHTLVITGGGASGIGFTAGGGFFSAVPIKLPTVCGTCTTKGLDIEMTNVGAGGGVNFGSYIAYKASNSAGTVVQQAIMNVGWENPTAGSESANWAVLTTASGTQTLAILTSSAGLFQAASGYKGKAGSSGSFGGNAMNTNWTGSCVEQFVDTSSLGCISTASDARIKTQIIALPSALSSVLALAPVSFVFDPKVSTDTSVHYGLLAQAVKKIYPDLVRQMPDIKSNGLTPDGLMQVKYEELIPVLIKAIHDMQDEIDTLKTQIR